LLMVVRMLLYMSNCLLMVVNMLSIGFVTGGSHLVVHCYDAEDWSGFRIPGATVLLGVAV
jgi:hypothetical protein